MGRSVSGNGYVALRLYSQLFTTSGTWTKPTNVTEIEVDIRGGGGGGGGGAVNRGGGGGGSGELMKYQIPTLSGSLTYTVTIGAGGSGGAAGINGSDGGASSFSANYIARGGGCGLTGATPYFPMGGNGQEVGGAGQSGLNSTQLGGFGGGAGGGNGGVGAATGSAGTANTGGGGGGGGGTASAGYAGGAGGSGFVRIYWWDV